MDTITRVAEFNIGREAAYTGGRRSRIEQINAYIAQTWDAARDVLHTLGAPRESMTMPELHDGNEWRIYGDSHRGRLFVSVYDRSSGVVGDHGGVCCGFHAPTCDLHLCHICP